MKLKFDPYVLEPFNDFYVFPHEQHIAEEQYRQLLYRDYQSDLVDIQHNYAQLLRNSQRRNQEMIADAHRAFAENMKDIPRHNLLHLYGDE